MKRNSDTEFVIGNVSQVPGCTCRPDLVCEQRRVSGVGVLFFYRSATHPLALLSIPCTDFAKYGGDGRRRRCVRLSDEELLPRSDATTQSCEYEAPFCLIGSSIRVMQRVDMCYGKVAVPGKFWTSFMGESYVVSARTSCRVCVTVPEANRGPGSSETHCQGDRQTTFP